MIYVLSDIHGNTERYNSIMQQINLQESDTLYVLGDVIDRYPDGIKILREIMKKANTKMLLGNHEYMMLNAIDSEYKLDEYEYNNLLRLWYRNGGLVTHNYIKHIFIKLFFCTVIHIYLKKRKWSKKYQNYLLKEVFQMKYTM